MSEKNENINKRIAQNTMLLYLRLIIVMGVSLFTVRIVLKALGVVDYGIHNVVAGIVITHSAISSFMIQNVPYSLTGALDHSSSKSTSISARRI